MSRLVKRCEMNSLNKKPRKNSPLYMNTYVQLPIVVYGIKLQANLLDYSTYRGGNISAIF